MDKVICVYSSSSCSIEKVYFDAAGQLGKEIAVRGDILLFGAGMTGLMGEIALAVHRNGGKMIGIIPEALNVKGIVYETCDELVVTKGMRERKAIMDERSDAFIALPGGFGTLEELLEIITLKQLRYHNKPIVLLNTHGFYDKLIEQFEEILVQRFAKQESRNLYFVADQISKALEYIDAYVPPEHGERWLTDVEKKET
ncbi:MAG: TIGR00730 family Rossman fold protein [Clostridia bacterium]|nr:TIGR00730 family Rossman fold protein [Clostridia bacterium]